MITVIPLVRHNSGFQPSCSQRGVVLLFSLVSLTVMLIGAVALISSFNASLLTAGNIGFKRDLANQAEHALKQVMDEFNAGGALENVSYRANSNMAKNYSAVVLSTNSLGIPVDLLKKDANFTSAGWNVAQDVSGSNGVKIRYLVDRLCQTTGNANISNPQIPCIRSGPPGGRLDKGDESRMRGRAEKAGKDVAAAVPEPVVYRVTMRAMGPRNTEAFYQATFTEPLPPPVTLPP